MYELLVSDNMRIVKSSLGLSQDDPNPGRGIVFWKLERIAKFVSNIGDIEDLAKFMLVFAESIIIFEMTQCTNVRTLTRFSYEEPNLFHRIRDSLRRIGVTLRLL